jgi:hypothetical protein
MEAGLGREANATGNHTVGSQQTANADFKSICKIVASSIYVNKVRARSMYCMYIAVVSLIQKIQAHMGLGDTTTLSSTLTWFQMQLKAKVLLTTHFLEIKRIQEYQLGEYSNLLHSLKDCGIIDDLHFDMHSFTQYPVKVRIFMLVK